MWGDNKESIATRIKMKRNDVQKRFSSLFESKRFSDCSFLVDNEEICAHKIVLVISSPVFEAMFYGPLATPDTIVVEDTSPVEFKQMLCFIYTDAANISGVDNAWALLYIAKKYLIDDLLDYCLQYIVHHMQPSNVLLNLEYADLYNETAIRQYCQSTVQKYPKFILQFDYQMKPSSLRLLLELDELNASEVELFELVVKWAEAECFEEQNASREQLRALLFQQDLMRLIRFVAMPLDALSEKPVSDMLTTEELSAIKCCIIDNNPESQRGLHALNFASNAQKRARVPLVQKLLFRAVYKIGELFHAHPHSELTTQIVVNKSVLIGGFILPTRRTPVKTNLGKYKERLRLELLESDVVIRRVNTNDSLEYGAALNVVKIAEPVILHERKTYLVKVSWQDDHLPWFTEYSMNYLAYKLNYGDVVFQFIDQFDCGFIQGISFCSI